MLEYKKVNKKVADSLLSSLSHLFSELQKKRSNSVKPTKFIQMLKKENEIFDNILQHDAQEFLNYLLNHIGDTLKNDAKAKNSTWVHDLFQVSYFRVFVIFIFIIRVLWQMLHDVSVVNQYQKRTNIFSTYLLILNLILQLITAWRVLVQQVIFIFINKIFFNEYLII